MKIILWGLVLCSTVAMAHPITDNTFQNQTVGWFHSNAKNCVEICAAQLGSPAPIGMASVTESEAFVDSSWTRPSLTNACKAYVAVNQENATQTGWLYGNNFSKGSRYGTYCMIQTDVYPSDPILSQDFMCLCAKRAFIIHNPTTH